MDDYVDISKFENLIKICRFIRDYEDIVIKHYYSRCGGTTCSFAFMTWSEFLEHVRKHTKKQDAYFISIVPTPRNEDHEALPFRKALYGNEFGAY